MMIDTLMAYSEVYEIINLLDEKYKERVPNKVKDFFKEKRLKEYKPKIDTKKPLTEQKLKRETIVLLAVLNLNYWCDTPEEKQDFLDELTQNDNEKKKILEIYNPDNLFKKNQNDSTGKEEAKNNQEVSLVEYKKQGLFKRILDKISRLFKKK